MDRATIFDLLKSVVAHYESHHGTHVTAVLTTSDGRDYKLAGGPTAYNDRYVALPYYEASRQVETKSPDGYGDTAFPTVVLMWEQILRIELDPSSQDKKESIGFKNQPSKEQ